MELSKNILEKLNTVNEKIDEILLPHKAMNEVMEYITAQKGKQLRPIMCLSAAEFGKKYSEDTVLLSALTEIIHMASLVHDDIIDKADKRRGVMSVQKKYGIDMALYAGDYMLASAFNEFCKISNINRYKILFNYFKKIVHSEINQHYKSYDLEITEEEYISNIYGKTACLFEFACVSGAITSSATKRITDQLKIYGYNFGILFQIRDDLSNYKIQTVDDKPCMNDFENGIYTLPLIYAVEDQREKILQLKNTVTQNGLCKENRIGLISLIKNSNALSKCIEKSKKYYISGMTALEKLPENSAKKIMLHMLKQIYNDISTYDFY